MGIQKWGAFGGFRKKAGNLVGRRVNGQNVISQLPHESERPPTEAQLSVRAMFKLVVTFMKWISPLIKVGFQHAGKPKQTPFNAAFRYNFENAVTGMYPNWEVDYPKFMYSVGMLGNSDSASVVADTAEQLDFSWDAVPNTSIGSGTDKATLLVYNPVKDRFVMQADAALRSALQYTMAMPANFGGDLVHVWMSFVSADRKMASNTVYLGEIEIVA
ncbi:MULTISPECIES: DUF6266 family protein [Pedobacter]|uniref:DUF6266 family protein n=1 Tax=Pedobacter TaxID=84567 RepID=UPI00210B821B|nr:MULTISPECIES: DUF6266 family protein [unclassified Pedobacter]